MIFYIFLIGFFLNLSLIYYNRYFKITKIIKSINNKSNYKVWVLSYGVSCKSVYNLCNEYINTLDIVKKSNKLIFFKYKTKKNNIVNLRRSLYQLKNMNISSKDKIIIIYNSFVNPYNMLSLIDNFNYKFIVINIEQASRNIIIDNLKSINKYNNKNIILCDYSYANIDLLKNENIKSTLLVYGINKKEIYNFDKNIDVLTINFYSKKISSSKRNNIYSLLKNNFSNYKDIKGWGYERDKILFRSKILINIHYFKDYTSFEEMRCNRCIYNKVIVISEYSYKWENFHLKKHMIFTDYDNIINKTQEVLDNYDYYYNLLFKDLKLE